MNDHDQDWLCDGVGEPDAVEREVEQALAPARWRGDPDGLLTALSQEPPADADSGARRARLARRAPHPATPRAHGWRRPTLVAAAGLTVLAVVWGVMQPEEAATWTRASGATWPVGHWIDTGAGEEQLVAAEIGRVTVGPGSRVRLLRTGEAEHRLELAEGSLEAFIFAPPELFFVETPAATAVDMGCAYELDVAVDGSGTLRVTGGWVELAPKDQNRMPSRVPAGAVCRISAAEGPGVPRFEDAPAAFTDALEGLATNRPGALGEALAQARARDSLTLWHLIGRTEGAAREAVVDRLIALVPADANREGALELDGPAMDLWWLSVRRAW